MYLCKALPLGLLAEARVVRLLPARVRLLAPLRLLPVPVPLRLLPAPAAAAHGRPLGAVEPGVAPRAVRVVLRGGGGGGGSRGVSVSGKVSGLTG